MSRPTPRRSSLAGSSPIQPPEQPATTPAAAEPAKAKAATPKPPKQTAPAPVIASTDAKGESRAVRQGIYITADEFADAKSAYLACEHRDCATTWGLTLAYDRPCEIGRAHV